MFLWDLGQEVQWDDDVNGTWVTLGSSDVFLGLQSCEGQWDCALYNGTWKSQGLPIPHTTLGWEGQWDFSVLDGTEELSKTYPVSLGTRRTGSGLLMGSGTPKHILMVPHDIQQFYTKILCNIQAYAVCTS